ncbi:MAG: amidase family protein [Candidatus Dojkabacteria bacterium]
MNHELLEKPIPELRKLLNAKKVSFQELMHIVSDRITYSETTINAYLTTRLDECIQEARDMDRGKYKKEKDSLLFGIPVSIKDSFTTKGIRTTAASKILENFVPEYNATAYARLQMAGSLVTGKVNMDEFAHGFTCEYSAFKKTANPWDTGTVPGGSSGGSAASVASREAFLSLASENFGSIIQPAALCGVVGMKPTYGRSSRFGIIAMASSMECPGIIGKCVEDVAIGIEEISGSDPLDATSVARPVENFYACLNKDLQGVKIAVIQPIVERVSQEISRAIEASCKELEKLGAIVEKINWYDLDIDGQMYDIFYRAEVSSNLARYDGIRFGNRPDRDFTSLEDYYLECRDAFGRHVKRQIITDPISLTENDEIYTQAQRIKHQNRDYIDRLFQKYSAIITPATTFTSLQLGQAEDTQWREENRHLAKINASMMSPTVLYGYPAVSFPIHVIAEKTPIGIHMFARRFDEQSLLNIAYAFQEATQLKCLQPPQL